MSQWIKVEDDLPKIGQTVFVLGYDGRALDGSKQVRFSITSIFSMEIYAEGAEPKANWNGHIRPFAWMPMPPGTPSFYSHIEHFKFESYEEDKQEIP